MARTVRDQRLDNRTARLRLPVKKEPYWRVISEGAHIGYYRGERGGKWVARYRAPGAKGGYAQATLGEADDHAEADGAIILNWKQASAAAMEWIDRTARGGRRTGPYTVNDALDGYLKAFTGKSVAKTKARIEVIIRPALGHHDVAKLTSRQITQWRDERAKSPARLRTSSKAAVANTRAVDSDDAIRRRRSTANRDLTVLKAALNWAYRAGHVSADDAWRKVKPFPNVDAAKLRYLSDDEARRLTNACDPVFRPMVQASLLTGGRYGELASVRVNDVDLKSGTLVMRDTKGGKPRIVYLEDEGVRLFAQACAGKLGSAYALSRPDGGKWNASQQARYMRTACEKAKVDPVATFHDLRRTYGARLALRGVPMAIIAEAMGHADERITRKHYAHLSPSHVADTVRAGMAGMGIVAVTAVQAIG